MGLTLKWDITYKCNLFCEHCINGEFLNNKQSELDTKEILQIIDEINNDIGIESISLLGGEPTIRKDLEQITDFLLEKDIKFGFNTNGLLLTSPKIRSILSNPCLKNIIVSLEGPTAEINDTIRGKNVFDKIIKGVKYLKDIKDKECLSNLTISVNTVLTKMNYKYVKDIINLCVNLGVDEINFLQLIQEGNASDKDLQLNNEEHVNLIKVIAEEYIDKKDILKINPRFLRPLAKDYCNEVLNLDFPDVFHGCGAGGTFAYINNVGELYPCDRYRTILRKNESAEDYSIKTKNFKTVWNKESFNIPYALTEGDSLYKNYIPCNKCKYLQKECYPCPAGASIEEKRVHKECLYYMNELKVQGESNNG